MLNCSKLVLDLKSTKNADLNFMHIKQINMFDARHVKYEQTNNNKKMIYDQRLFD